MHDNKQIDQIEEPMRTLNTTEDPIQSDYIQQLVKICAWLESETGFYALNYKGPGYSYLSDTISSKLHNLKYVLCQLFDGWPETDFIIDLRHYLCPLDAFCEVMSLVEEIERSRGLQAGHLKKRIIFVTGDENKTESEVEALRILEGKEIQAKLNKERGVPLNSPREKLEALIG
jgi:hypothetical protein